MKTFFLVLNIVTVNKSIVFPIFRLFTQLVRKILKTIVAMFLYKLRSWDKKSDATPSKNCKFHSIDGEAHSNVSGFFDRTLAECYKSILPNFQNDNEATLRARYTSQIEQSFIKHVGS